jgi:glycosyltransferase involved in cell wall biosynthesis
VQASWILPSSGPLLNVLQTRGDTVWVMDDLAIARRRERDPRQLLALTAKLLRSSFRIARIVKEQAIEIIHSNSAAVLSGAAASRLNGVPHVWHVHEIVPENGALSRALVGQMPQRCEALLCVSSAVARQFDGLGGTEPEIAHNGFDPRRLRPIDRGSARDSFGIPTDATVIGCASYLNQRKGVDVLIDAYAAAQQQSPGPTRLLLAGEPFPGNEATAKSLKDRALALGLRDEVIFTGFVTDIARFYSAIDIFAMPASEPEGFGLAVLEAMACALPVITSEAGGPLDLIEQGRTGILVSPDSISDAAHWLANLISDPGLRKRLGVAAQRSARQSFSLNRAAQQLERVYLSLAHDVY